MNRELKIKELQKLQHVRYFETPVKPIEVRTVEGQIPFSEYGVINDRYARELNEVQQIDMIKHCQKYKPIEIPEGMKYPTSKMTEVSLKAFFAQWLP